MLDYEGRHLAAAVRWLILQGVYDEASEGPPRSLAALLAKAERDGVRKGLKEAAARCESVIRALGGPAEEREAPDA